MKQEAVKSMPKDRGAEQGDVDGPLECSLALGMVAAEARLHVATSGGNPAAGWCQQSWRSAKTPNFFQSTMLLLQNFPTGGSEKLTGADDPRHAVQKKKVAWQTSGVSLAATYCAIQHSFFLILEPSTQLMFK